MTREQIVAELQKAGVRNPAQAIADGMTVQTFVRICESNEAKATDTEPRWQREMREPQ